MNLSVALFALLLSHNECSMRDRFTKQHCAQIRWGIEKSSTVMYNWAGSDEELITFSYSTAYVVSEIALRNERARPLFNDILLFRWPTASRPSSSPTAHAHRRKDRAASTRWELIFDLWFYRFIKLCACMRSCLTMSCKRERGFTIYTEVQ